MKKVLIGVGIIAGVLLAIYVGFAIYFNSHYIFNTTINSIDSTGKTPEYVIKKCSSVASDYLLTIKDRNDNKFHIKGIDIDYQYVPLGEEEEILESQNPWAWPESFFKSYEYDLSTSVSFDPALYEKVFDELEIFSKDYITEPVDACVKINSDNYEVVPEINGNSPVKEKINSLVIEALESENDSIVLTDDCYLTPNVLSTDTVITNAAETIERYINSPVHYLIDNANENFTSEMILKMLSIDSKGNVNIDRSIADQFAQHLASTYNTYADVREFRTTKGDTIKIGGGDYGWVINKPAEADQIIADLEGGVPVEREPIYSQRAIKSGLDDIGDTYIEIDYTNQHLWYYKDGDLVSDTDIVSGNLNKHNGSVDGVFKIAYKQKDATLVGEGYSSPVSYFMPFAYNIGIHDASWRSSFGKQIYKTSGSHGCINVPKKAVIKLFDEVATGTPVVAYYREKVELTNNAARISNAYSYVQTDDNDNSKKKKH